MISRSYRSLALLSLIIFNLWLGFGLHLKNTDIDHFFPTPENGAQISGPLEYRLLFIHTTDSDKLESLQEKQVIENYFEIPTVENAYITLYDKEKQPSLLSNFEPAHYMGTPILGELLSEEFLTQTYQYLLILIPVLIPFIIWLTSFRYLFILTFELSIFSAFLLSLIHISNISLNPAYLLSLLFVYLYAFTTINQVHFNHIETKPLSFSIAVSIVTTFISAFLLSFSEFGVISDFGRSLMIWLGILSFFMLLRLWLGNRTPMPLKWFHPKATFLTKWLLFGFIGSIVLLSVWSYNQNSNIQFNPLLQSSHKTYISEFEKQYLSAQPVMVEIHAKQCRLNTYKCNQKLAKIQSQILQQFPQPPQPVIDLNSLYQQFTDKSFSDSTAPGFAQFKLALEMSDMDKILYSANMKTSYMTFTVSLLTPIEDLAQAREKLLKISEQSAEFDLTLIGRFNDIAYYENRFIHEMWVGISVILIVLLVGISMLYRDIKANISLLPAILTLCLFVGLHVVFEIGFTIMSLVAVILFVGLIADNIIHILVAYKNHAENCFRIALKPIVLSNVILISSLGLVLFIDTGFLKIFGLEMSLLLLLHLLLIYLLMPSLLRSGLSKNAKH